MIKPRPHLACSAADGLDIKKVKAEVISGAVTFIPRLIETRHLFQNTTEQDVHTRRNQDELAPVPSSSSSYIYHGVGPLVDPFRSHVSNLLHKIFLWQNVSTVLSHHQAWWWLSRVETCCHKNILCNKLVCLTEIYTLYELGRQTCNIRKRTMKHSLLWNLITTLLNYLFL